MKRPLPDISNMHNVVAGENFMDLKKHEVLNFGGYVFGREKKTLIEGDIQWIDHPFKDVRMWVTIHDANDHPGWEPDWVLLFQINFGSAGYSFPASTGNKTLDPREVIRSSLAQINNRMEAEINKLSNMQINIIRMKPLVTELYKHAKKG